MRVLRLFVYLFVAMATGWPAHAQERTAFVHLFEWSWDDIAKECGYLGEKGCAAVQVSPPNEHIQGPEWWTRYQPVSYIVQSRSGDRGAFANMVAFRNHTVSAWSVDNRWSNGANQIAFSRGDKGFVVINNENYPLKQTLFTGMAPGTYCNVIEGDFDGGACSGPTISVDGSRFAHFEVPARRAAAIHVGALVGGPAPDPDDDGIIDVRFTCENGHTYWGQAVYVVGNHGSIGNWSPANGVRLDPTAYPIWTGTLKLPASTQIQWKCIKREKADQNAGIQWQSGDNNSFATPASGAKSVSGSF